MAFQDSDEGLSAILKAGEIVEFVFVFTLIIQ